MLKRKNYQLVTDKDETESSPPEDTPSKKPKTDIWNGNLDTPSIETYKNHIFFYCGVTKK